MGSCNTERVVNSGHPSASGVSQLRREVYWLSWPLTQWVLRRGGGGGRYTPPADDAERVSRAEEVVLVGELVLVGQWVGQCLHSRLTGSTQGPGQERLARSLAERSRKQHDQSSS